ncbi:MAG: diphosphate--fructose-6-phosphate 1-phosphotransferase [Nitrospirales bacterium]
MSPTTPKFGILVGGGPAPGINSVIEAATIRSRLSGTDVLGLEDGFKWLMQGDLSHTQSLTRQTVSHIHFRGGSILGTARANPTKHLEDLSITLKALQQLNITGLITIGGDDTAFSAFKLSELAGGRIQVVHVPKTIDNDLCLPHGMPTFGFQTARHMGVGLVKNLMIDAHTTSRWYFVVTMGRKAGHLALGIGKAAGATVTLIPEEFRGGQLKLGHLTTILAGSIIKRLAQHRADGVAVLAEGLSELLDQEDLTLLGGVERDEHGHIRLAELDIGKVLKDTVTQKLKHHDIKITIVSKNIGYELRCADPIPFDMEYTRDLGYCAAQYLLDGGKEAMISMIDGRFTPLPFKDMLDPATGRTRVRMVDTDSESYQIARAYMARLQSEDLSNPETVSQYANTLNLSPEQFRTAFQEIAHKE